MTVSRHLLFPLFLAVWGCASIPGARDPFPVVNLSGVRVGETEVVRVIGGVQGEDEPCLNGFERSFGEIGVTIGYGFDGRIRRIVTGTPLMSMDGVSPGMGGDEAHHRLTIAGWTGDGNGEYRRGPYSLFVHSDGTGRVRLLRLEKRRTKGDGS